MFIYQLTKIKNLIENVKLESLHLSLDDVHHSNLVSLVIGGTEFGNLTRIFIAESKIEPYAAQLHTHRYPIMLTKLKGSIKHHIANRGYPYEPGIVKIPEYKYNSPIDNKQSMEYQGFNCFHLNEYEIPTGSIIKLNIDEFHTVSCACGSMWMVEELGYQSLFNSVLGIPFKTEGLYNPLSDTMIAHHCNNVSKVVHDLLESYK